jgi:crotonobetainyl-CoA:carnitine CoA-transferase CaiB-like acyl-CoA transferase
MYVPLGAFHTKDGCLAISVMHDHHFVSLCQALDKQDWGSNPLYETRVKRIERETEVVDMVRTAFRQFTTAELSERLTQAGVLHSLVLKYPEMLQHPQVKHAEAVAWVEQDGIGQPLPFPSIPGVSQNNLPAGIQAPHIGQHSAEILQEWGADRPAINGMISRGAVRVWGDTTTGKKA